MVRMIKESSIFTIKKDGKYVKDQTDGEKLTKSYSQAEKFTNRKSAEEAARDYGRRYGRGYSVSQISGGDKQKYYNCESAEKNKFIMKNELNEKSDYPYTGNAFYSFGHMQQIKSHLEFLQRLYESAVDNQLAATSESKKLYAVVDDAVNDAVKAFIDLLNTYDKDYLSK